MSMYKNHFVAAMKVDGKVLREDGEKVYIPFGKEYAIHLANLDQTRSAVVEIEIDGKNITRNGIILRPGQEFDLERALEDDMNKGNKFKFIERTGAIEAHRGVGTKDGLVIIKFQHEKARAYVPPYTGIRTPGWPSDVARGPLRTYSKGFLGSAGDNVLYSTNSVTASASANSGELTRGVSTQSVNQVGITGKGSESNQSFVQGYIGELEPEVKTIIFQLLGKIGTEEVAKPVEVKTRKVCSLCGKKYDSNVKYCSDDGNFLEFDKEVFIK